MWNTLVTKVVIELHDGELETCNILYYYIDGQLKEELLSIEELHEKLYFLRDKDFGKKWKDLKGNLGRFMYAGFYFDFLNRYPVSEIQYNVYGMEIPSLPISLNIKNIALGLCEMINLGCQLGWYTPIYLRYNEKEEVLTLGRGFHINEDSLALMFSFLRKNKIEVQGISCYDIDFSTFFALISYSFSWLLKQCSNGYVELPEIYGDVLLEKVRKYCM